MDKSPDLIIETMIYSRFSKCLAENTYFVRGDKEDGNPLVEALLLAKIMVKLIS